MRNFRDLEIWNISIELVADIYKLGALFPKEETYGLKSQILRAASSVPANIAEATAEAQIRSSYDTLKLPLDRYLN